MITATVKDFLSSIFPRMMRNIDCGAFCMVSDELWVHYYDENDVNLEYCVEHNIPCYKFQRPGGCIIADVGDPGIATNRPADGPNMNNLLFIAFKDYLQNEKNVTDDITFNKNDFLIDGKKVIASSATYYGDNNEYVIYSAHFSVNDNTELIKKICKKPMIKAPGCLSNYGVTTEELVTFFEKFFNEHNL